MGDDVPRPRRLHLIKFFSSAPDAPRFRRPSDVLMLLLAVLGLVLLAVPAPGPTRIDTAVTDLLAAIPGVDGWGWQIAYVLLPLWTGVLLVVTLGARGRRRLVLDLLLAGVLGTLLALLAGALSGTDLATTVRGIVSTDPPAVYVGALLAVTSAVIVTASPHLSRPTRNLGRALLLLGAVAGVGLGVALPIGMTGGLLVGLAAASVTHLLLGSPDGRPTAQEAALALSDLGVPCGGLRDSDRQGAGVARFEGEGDDGAALQVDVYGRDARDNELLMSFWRSLWLRGETVRLDRGRLRMVEHESVVRLLAERAGVRVAPLVAVGQSGDGDAVIVTGGGGRPLRDVPAQDLDDAVLADAWSQLVRLHGLGIAHGHVDGLSVELDASGAVRLTALTEAELSAGEVARGVDSAQMLVTTALAVGDERAVAAARAAIGDDGLATVLPFLQPAVLDRRTRSAVRAGQWDLKGLAAQVVEVTGVEPAPLQKLRRLGLKNVVVVVGGALLGYLVVSKLLDVDWSSLWEEMKGADWWWVGGALAVSPLVGAALAFSTLGASLRPLRYGAVVMLEWAIQFMAVVLPSTAARLALDVRFFERFGIPAAGALSMGVIDSVSGFVVQALLLLVILVSPLPGLTSPIQHGGGGSSDGGPSTGLLILAGLVVVVVVALLLPVTRRRIRARLPQLREAVREHAGAARTALGVLRHPVKVGEMLLGNLGAQLIQAVILAMCLRAFGGEAHFSQLILINTIVALFGGLMPVPGGVGVTEAAMTAGLQAVGVPSTVALSTTVAFRLATFYLPPIWGSFAMGWLRRRSYV